MQGNDVEFFDGRVSKAQLRTNRPSYINAVLIQSRGAVNAAPCRTNTVLKVKNKIICTNTKGI
jgi:hypothetical protein